MSDSEAYKVAETSLHADDWPGVIFKLSAEWRLAVDRDRKRYHCQKRGLSPEGTPVWLAPRGHKAKTLSALVAGCHDVPGLEYAVQGFPENPSEYRGDFVAAAERASALYAATDWRREDYSRVVCRDGNLRLAVDPSGEYYRLQWIAPEAQRMGQPQNNWTTLRACDTLAPIRAILAHLRDVSGEDRPQGFQPAPALQAEVQTLPERAADGNWPPLPKRPEGVVPLE